MGSYCQEYFCGATISSAAVQRVILSCEYYFRTHLPVGLRDEEASD